MNGGLATLCYSDAEEAASHGLALLDPAKVKGKIVVCTRGLDGPNREDKRGRC